MVSSEALPILQVLDHVVLKPLYMTGSPVDKKGNNESQYLPLWPQGKAMRMMKSLIRGGIQ